MPKIRVDDIGTEYYYEDTGRPGSSDDYDTIVLVHGMVVHGAIFRRMFKYAAAHHIRLVAVNLRDYPGTTPFRPEEFDQYSSADYERKAAGVRQLGAELAIFLLKFAEMNKIQPISLKDGKRRGGLAVFGWSLGSVITLGFLGNAWAFDKEIQAAVETYLRTVIMFDPPCFAYGVPPPEGLVSPAVDPKIPNEHRMDYFTKWVSRYSEPVPDLSVATPAYLIARKPLQDPSDPRSVSTVERMTPEEAASVNDFGAFTRWASLLRIPPLYQENTRRALFDTQGVWKDVNVVVLWADMSQWIVHVGARDIAEKIADPAYGGERRKIVLEKVTNANHFIHWDQPERTVQLLVDYLN